ncbi:MAG: hypothetical protein ABIB71_02080 [Candidatus Woesearchaeota archaeon]
MKLINIIASEAVRKPISSSINFLLSDSAKEDLAHKLHNELSKSMESYLSYRAGLVYDNKPLYMSKTPDIEVVLHEEYHTRVNRKNLSQARFWALEEAQAEAVRYAGSSAIKKMKKLWKSINCLKLYNDLVEGWVDLKPKGGNSEWVKNLEHMTYNLFYWPCMRLIKKRGQDKAEEVFMQSLEEAIRASDINVGVKVLVRDDWLMRSLYNTRFMEFRENSYFAGSSELEGGRAELYTERWDVVEACSSVLPDFKIFNQEFQVKI